MHITFHSLAHSDTLPPPAGGPGVTSLAELVSATLDATQQETRASLTVDPCPPSGRGNDRATIIPEAL